MSLGFDIMFAMLSRSACMRPAQQPGSSADPSTTEQKTSDAASAISDVHSTASSSQTSSAVSVQSTTHSATEQKTNDLASGILTTAPAIELFSFSPDCTVVCSPAQLQPHPPTPKPDLPRTPPDQTPSEIPVRSPSPVHPSGSSGVAAHRSDSDGTERSIADEFWFFLPHDL